MTAGDAGLEDYRQALALYEEHGAPVDDRLRALAGTLMVAMRWVGSVGGRPSEQYILQLRGRGEELLKAASDRYAIARFLAADAFFPFWIQSERLPTAEEMSIAHDHASAARQIAAELGDADLESMTLDALAGTAQAVADWSSARETSHERLKLESSLGFYERLDAHSMAAWMSFYLGDLAQADRDSADMAARILPGQAPYPSLHLFAWRALTLDLLGRWDEAVSTFWRAIEAWHDAGRHAAGYALRGFAVGVDIGRARGDSRLMGTASEAMESIVARFPPGQWNRAWEPYAHGESMLAEVTSFSRTEISSECLERRLSLSSDRREQLSEPTVEAALKRALDARDPLLEAQALRARALLRSDPADMKLALEKWENAGAIPLIGRARAELGVLTGDRGEMEAGMAILKKLGDTGYLDRFAARV